MKEIKDVKVVAAFRGRGHSQEKLWGEIVHDPLVALRPGVMNLVNQNVIKVIGGEAVQVFLP